MVSGKPPLLAEPERKGRQVCLHAEDGGHWEKAQGETREKISGCRTAKQTVDQRDEQTTYGGSGANQWNQERGRLLDECGG